jgi:hypothetical protein
MHASGVKISANVVTPPSPQGLGPSGRYSEALQSGAFGIYFSWNRARILQELIDSTTGVVDPSRSGHDTVDGTDGFALFATPAEARSLFYSYMYMYM